MSKIIKINVLKKATENRSGEYILHFDDLGDIQLNFNEDKNNCIINNCKGIIYTESNRIDFIGQKEEREMLENPNKFFLDNFYNPDLAMAGLIFILNNKEDMDKFLDKNVLINIVKPSTMIGEDDEVYLGLNMEKCLTHCTLH